MRIVLIFLLLFFAGSGCQSFAHGGGGFGGGHSYGGHSLGRSSEGDRSHGDTWVHMYVRSNGTIVTGHYRSHPDGDFYNNWSTKGNINPHTGKPGTRVTPPSYFGAHRWPAPSRPHAERHYLTPRHEGNSTGDEDTWYGPIVTALLDRPDDSPGVPSNRHAPLGPHFKRPPQIGDRDVFALNNGNRAVGTVTGTLQSGNIITYIIDTPHGSRSLTMQDIYTMRKATDDDDSLDNTAWK